MYLGSWQIDDYLTFPANTHDAATGAATDDDSVPSYRIYEDETGTAIVTGSMAKLDDTNTTGFYSERVQLTAAAGFEVGKTYTIYISGTVATIVGTLSHTFQMGAEVALHADWVNGGRLDLLLDAVKASTDDWVDGQRLDMLLDAIKAISDDWINGGRLDLLLDAVKAITDAIPDSGALTSLITHLTDIKGATFSGATDSLEALRDRGDAAWITGESPPAGAGAIEWDYTLTSTVGDTPIADADIWVTTDILGANVVASGRTDALDVVTFYLDAATYYIWRKKNGFNFTNPDTEIVS